MSELVLRTGAVTVLGSGCTWVGTAVCVELLNGDENDPVGEDGREGVGVRAEEASERALAVATAERIGVRGVDDVGFGVVGAEDGWGWLTDTQREMLLTEGRA